MNVFVGIAAVVGIASASTLSLPTSCNGTIVLTAGKYVADGQKYVHCTIIGQNGTVISGSFTATTLDLMGQIRFESSVDQGKWFNILDSHVSWKGSSPHGVVVSDGSFGPGGGDQWIRIDGGSQPWSSVSANGYNLNLPDSPIGLSIGNRARVHFSSTRVELGMGMLQVTDGAIFLLTDGSYLYSRGPSYVSNASASVVDSKMIHMKSFDISESQFVLRRSPLEVGSFLTVEHSLLSVESSNIQHEYALTITSSDTTFRNASFRGGASSIYDHKIIGGNTAYVNTSLHLNSANFTLSLWSDSQVLIVNTTVTVENSGGLVVTGEPSINVDKGSQIHCGSGHFVPRSSGHNGSISVEGSLMSFSSCSSSEQASFAETELEGKSAAVFII